MTLLLAALCACAGTYATPAGAATYTANCANTYYLDFKPHYWSNGCTGGALNVTRLHWLSYGTRRARATGRAELRRPCGNQPCYKAGIYKARARIRMWWPRRCGNGAAAGERFFSRVRVRVRFRRGNPFGYRAGWKGYFFKIRAYEGTCEYAP